MLQTWAWGSGFWTSKSKKNLKRANKFLKRAKQIFKRAKIFLLFDSSEVFVELCFPNVFRLLLLAFLVSGSSSTCG